MFLEKKKITYALTNDHQNPINKEIYKPVVLHDGVDQESIDRFLNFFETEIDKKIDRFHKTIDMLEDQKSTFQIEMVLKLLREQAEDADDDKHDIINLLETSR
jgi:hypothetical protein